MKKNKGFTLAEMLIVVAIIGILVAILIPTFTAQLEKAKEASDAANIRSAISEVTVAYLSGATAVDSTTGYLTDYKEVAYDATNKKYTKTVKCTQRGTFDYTKEAGGISLSGNKYKDATSITVTLVEATGQVTLTKN